MAAAAGAPFAAVEAALRGAVDGPGADPTEALAVLVPGYTAQFRVAEAERLSARWVELAPADPRAWAARADVLERLERRDAAREAFGRWVEVAPADRRARLGLVRMLLAARRPPGEVFPHLEHLAATTPDDPEVLRFRAAVLEAEGRTDEAVAVLDRAVARPDVGALVLHQRARLDLDRGRSADALPFARRAVAADPSDVEARYTLFRCLQQVGSPVEAAEAEVRWKQVRDDLARVRELGRRIAASPSDPELRREIGDLFLRNGREADGLRWLESALALSPEHAPTHQTLAAYYARTSRPELAAAHRSRTAP